MPEVLFHFVKQAASLAQRRCAASPLAVVSDPTGHGFDDWKHLTLHFLRVHMDASYAEVVDWASEMDRERVVLQLARGEISRCDDSGRAERFTPRIRQRVRVGARRSGATGVPSHLRIVPSKSTVR